MDAPITTPERCRLELEQVQKGGRRTQFRLPLRKLDGAATDAAVRAMVRPNREMLSGVVEVDETYVGGEEPGGRGRYTETKAIVAIAVEIKEVGYGRVRLRRIPNVRRTTLEAFVQDMIAPGSISAPTTAGSAASTWTTTSTSTPSASTDDRRALAACSSTGCWKRLCRRPTRLLTPCSVEHHE